MVWKHSKSMLYFESVLESEEKACGLRLQRAFVISSSSGSSSSIGCSSSSSSSSSSR